MKGFQEHAKGIWIREYPDYDGYVAHQGAKRRTVAQDHARNYEARCEGFKYEFCQISNATVGPVLCLGARDGCEVDALRRLGYMAVGIDVDYPYPSPFVHYGDVHQIPYPDESFKTVYTNVMDHLLKPVTALSEIRRVLYWNGIFAVRLTPGTEEGLSYGQYESCLWDTRAEMVQFIEAHGFHEIWQKTITAENYYTLHGFWIER